MNDIFIHIGMPRSASTWLQQNVFSNNDKIISLGRKNWINRWHGNPDVDSYYNQEIHDFFWAYVNFSNSKEFYKKNFNITINDKIDKLRIDNKCILSQELLTCSIFGRVEISQRLERIHETFSNYKIIFIIREQLSYLISLHKIALKGLGMNITLRQFLDWYLMTPFGGHSYELDYNAIYSFFKNKNIDCLCVPYELLKNDKLQFCSMVFNFLNIQQHAIKFNPVNSGDSVEHDICRWYLNNKYPHFFGADYFSFPISESLYHLIPSHSTLIPRFKKQIMKSGFVWNRSAEIVNKINPNFFNQIKEEWAPTVEQKVEIQRQYADSNRKLQSALGINLEEYGYAI